MIAEGCINKIYSPPQIQPEQIIIHMQKIYTRPSAHKNELNIAYEKAQATTPISKEENFTSRISCLQNSGCMLVSKRNDPSTRWLNREVVTDKLQYTVCKDSSLINAKDYVSLSMIKKSHADNYGLTLDNSGQLVMIKGKGYNLTEGLLKKYTTGYKYETATIKNSDGLTFSSLHVNEVGSLIGRLKNNDGLYEINIRSKEGTPLCSVDKRKLDVVFERCDEQPLDELRFDIGEGRNVSFIFDGNKLKIKKISCGDDDIKTNLDYSLLDYDIKLPLKKGYNLSSVKKTLNVLQLEVVKGKKHRIFYLDPKHILLKKKVARKISHKPPQSFSGMMGSDMHEKYHAGQPFSSDRKGNFSSNHMPIFSHLIDNIRFHAKSANGKFAEGKKTSAMKQVAKGSDIGFACISSSIKRIKENINVNYSSGSKKKKQYNYNRDLINYNKKDLTKVIRHAAGIRDKLNFADSVLNLVNNLKPQESINISNTTKLSASFGYAAGGLPFHGGGVVGVMVTLGKSHDFILSKDKKENIKCSFIRNGNAGAGAMLGTWHGLENKLFSTDSNDYLTVLPVEANLIMAFQRNKKESFSFNLTAIDFEKFIHQFSDDKADSPLDDKILSESTSVQNIDNEFLLSLQAKSELRLQLGSMEKPSKMMIQPRSAVGANAAFDVLKVNFASERKITGVNNTIKSNKKTVRVATPSFHIFKEDKIIPFTMSDIDGHDGGNHHDRKEHEINESAGESTFLFHDLSSENEIHHLKKVNKTWLKLSQEKIKNKNSGRSYFSKGASSNIAEAHFQPPQLHCDLSVLKDIPLKLTGKKNGYSRQMKLSDVSKSNELAQTLLENLSEIKNRLKQQERLNINKRCKINIILHYEDSNMEQRKTLTSPAGEASWKLKSGKAGNGLRTEIMGNYHLKKIEFRRETSVNDNKFIIPTVFFRIKNNNKLAYDEHLGDIHLNYADINHMQLTSLHNNLKFIY